MKTKTPLNTAFRNRFARHVEYEYLSPSVEASMLHHRTNLALAACRIMTDFAALTRKDAAAGKLTMGVTPRRLIAWARVVMVRMSSADAFAQAVVQGTAPEDREALARLASTSLESKHATIDALAGGDIPAPAEPIAEPARTDQAFSGGGSQRTGSRSLPGTLCRIALRACYIVFRRHR
jgi:hypothetical protein